MTEKQERALSALLTSPNIKAAAEIANVPLRTLYGWRSSPEFADELNRRRRELSESAFTSLQARLTEAVDVVVQIMGNNKLSARVRLQAAKILLEYGFKGYELLDIVPRIEALEDISRAKLPIIADYRRRKEII